MNFFFEKEISYLLEQSWRHPVRALKPPVVSISCGKDYQKKKKKKRKGRKRWTFWGHFWRERVRFWRREWPEQVTWPLLCSYWKRVSDNNLIDYFLAAFENPDLRSTVKAPGVWIKRVNFYFLFLIILCWRRFYASVKGKLFSRSPTFIAWVSICWPPHFIFHKTLIVWKIEFLNKKCFWVKVLFLWFCQKYIFFGHFRLLKPLKTLLIFFY